MQVHVRAPLLICDLEFTICALGSETLVPVNAQIVNFKAPVPQQLQGEFRKLVFVGASPTGGSNLKCGVVSAECGIKEVWQTLSCFLLRNSHSALNSGSWCNSSISPCEGDGSGANPGFLTSFNHFRL